MKLNFERTQGVVIVTSCARVDSDNAGAFQRALCEILQEGDRALVVDFTPLNYIGSAGLRAILLTAKDLGQRAVGFGLCEIEPHVRKLFAIGVDEVVSIHKTRKEAVASFSD
ncbi:MAG: STAS domain-containing protein [Bryobacterales bacterium]|nr:STAS domain-containing protein [Bryobacterales bacterium]MDE0262646.1 STAS domain-containing protein [Bryobacterales bacterium]MDE0623566.1 STAS domain-containing protein [Bryobacterales bacterium]